MATPVYITGFESGVNPNTNGLGLWNSVNGSPVADSSIKRTGAYSLKIVAPGSGTSYNCRKNIGASVQTAVGTFHFYVPTGGTPSANTIVAGFTFGTYTGTAGLHLTSAGLVRAQVGSGTVQGSTTLVLDQWHRVDFRLVITTSTWTLEWYLDGVQQTNATMTGQPTNDSIAGIRFGSSSTTATYTIYFDDCVVTETSGDYPLGDIAVEALFPTSDGTHNAGTNVIEDQAGNDIGAVTAYDKINSNPTSGSDYLRQVAIGTGNYAEVQFGNIQASHSSIIGAMGVLAYSAETSTANKGACVVSKDAFSTKTAIWGDTTATADYSDGTASAPFWKSAIVVGANTTSLVNALTARVGYSDDATPNPYWVDLFIEVAYVPSSDIVLDLVTYSNTFNAVTILENVVIPLDLVTYSNTFNTVEILENIVVPLDAVIYSNSFNDIIILENVVVSLDLVTYENDFNDITILENIVVDLDLVTYSSTVNDVVITENILILLDLVAYSSVFNDVVLLENEIVVLDLVTYSSIVNDIDVLEDGDISLDLVTYSNTFSDLVILESEIVLLDLVVYSNSFNDLVILENLIILLDLVVYSNLFNDITVLEEGDILLDLVTYVSVFNNVLIISQSGAVNVPPKRVYAIERSNRTFAIEKEIRTY